MTRTMNRQEGSLMALDQFLAEVRALPSWSDEERLALLARVAQGDQHARGLVLQSCLRYIVHWAPRLLREEDRCDVLDVVQCGCEALLQATEQALEYPSPVGYVLKKAKFAMIRWLSRYGSLIVTPDEVEAFSVDSLDRQAFENSGKPNEQLVIDTLAAPDELVAMGALVEGEQAHPALYAALASLSQERRMVLARRYGLLGEAPTTVAVLAQELYPHLTVEQASSKLLSQERLALLQLQRILAQTYYPQMYQIPEEVYTLQEVADLFGVNVRAVYNWAGKGRLTCYELPERSGTPLRYVYAKAEVDALHAQIQVGRDLLVSQEYYTVQEVMQRAGVSTSVVYRWLKSGKVRSYHVMMSGLREQVLCAKGDVEMLIAAQQRGQVSPARGNAHWFGRNGAAARAVVAHL